MEGGRSGCACRTPEAQQQFLSRRLTGTVQAAACVSRMLRCRAVSSSSYADKGTAAHVSSAQRLDAASPDQRHADSQKHAISDLLCRFQQQVILLNILELDGVGGRSPSVKVMHDLMRSINAHDYHFPASAFAKFSCLPCFFSVFWGKPPNKSK